MLSAPAGLWLTLVHDGFAVMRSRRARESATAEHRAITNSSSIEKCMVYERTLKMFDLGGYRQNSGSVQRTSKIGYRVCVVHRAALSCLLVLLYDLIAPVMRCSSSCLLKGASKTRNITACEEAHSCRCHCR
jgi:hypothetical protein